MSAFLTVFAMRPNSGRIADTGIRNPIQKIFLRVWGGGGHLSGMTTIRTLHSILLCTLLATAANAADDAVSAVPSCPV